MLVAIQYIISFWCSVPWFIVNIALFMKKILKDLFKYELFYIMPNPTQRKN